ncbi:hypothetical protein [Shewanella phage FishSpeaker]|nr:hypothetical protein [Shewanella phage FishSpeaker]
MISGILRDKRQHTSHNSLSTKDVSAYLLSSLVPEKVIDGNEGLVDGVINAVKSVIKKIVEGFKWLWNKLFGSGGDVAGFKKGLKELKGAKLKPQGLTFNKKILYFVKREHWGDATSALKDLVDTSETLLKMAKRINGLMLNYQRTYISEKFISDQRNDKHSKIESTFAISPGLVIEFKYDPSQKEKTSKDNVTIEKTAVTAAEAEQNNGIFNITREAFETIVKNLISIDEEIKTSEKSFLEITKMWETHFKNFTYTDKFKNAGDSQSQDDFNKAYFVETANYLNVQFKLIKTLWINFTKEIEEFKSLVESFTEK